MNEIQTHPTVHVPTATMMTEGCRNAGGILVKEKYGILVFTPGTDLKMTSKIWDRNRKLWNILTNIPSK